MPPYIYMSASQLTQDGPRQKISVFLCVRVSAQTNVLIAEPHNIDTVRAHLVLFSLRRYGVLLDNLQ